MEKRISLLMLLGCLLAIPSSFLIPDVVISSKIIGDLFISTLKLVVPFIIFISISYSIASFDTNTKLKKMIPLTIILYILSTTISISFSLAISSQVNFPINEALISELNFKQRKVNLSIKLLEELQNQEAVSKFSSPLSGKNLPFSSLSDKLEDKKTKKEE